MLLVCYWNGALLILFIFFLSSWQKVGKDVVLQWPTQVSCNPVDDSITILDEGFLFVLSKEGVVFPLAINDCNEDDER